MLGLRCCAGFSLVAARGGLLFIAVPWFLIAVASLVVEHQLKGAWASRVSTPRLWSTGSAVVAQGLSCSAAVGSSLTRDQPCAGRLILYH